MAVMDQSDHDNSPVPDERDCQENRLEKFFSPKWPFTVEIGRLASTHRSRREP